MWDYPKFISHFPEPSKRTKEHWKLIGQYSRLWNKAFAESIRRDKEAELVAHLEASFMIIGDEDLDSEW